MVDYKFEIGDVVRIKDDFMAHMPLYVESRGKQGVVTLIDEFWHPMTIWVKLLVGQQELAYDPDDLTKISK